MGVMWGSLYVFGVFFKSLLAEFGWSRGATSMAFSLAAILVGLGSIFTGRLTDRIGPRKVTTACGVIMGLGFLLLSTINSLWQLYLYYALVGIGVSGAFVPMASTIARWFVKRRGMMTGVTVAGLGVGTLVMPPLATWLIQVLTWRNAYVVVGIVSILLVLTAARLLKRDPRVMGLVPYGEDESAGADHSMAGGFTLQEAMATRQFWILCWIYIFYCLGLGAVLAHIVLHGIDTGATPAKAAVIMSFIGAFSTTGRIVMGSAGDRAGYKRTIAFGFALMSVSLFWLLLAKDLWALYLFGAAFGFGYGGLAALFSPFIAEQFGLKSHGIILGVLMIASQIGESIGPVVTGYVFDIGGSYLPAFFVWAVLVTAALALVLMFRTPQKPI